MAEPIDRTPVVLTQRFVDFIAFLEGRGGKYQRTRAGLAADTGLTDNKLRHITQRGVELGVLRVERITPPMVGVGALPNRYVLLMTTQQWLERRDGLLADEAARKKAARDARRPPKKIKRSPIPNRAVALAKVESPMAVTASPAERARVAADEDLDVDAWAGAIDFD